MQSRDRIYNSIARLPVDRVGVFESFWWETEAEWHRQGLPEDVPAEEFFDLDAGMFWFDQSFQLPARTLAEDAESKVVTDEWGTSQQVFKTQQSTPGHLGFAIQTREQWEDEYKPRLAYHGDRIDWAALEARYRHLRDGGKYTILSMLDPFECTWHKVGPERQFMLMVEDPAWLCDMFEADTALLEAAFEDLCARGFTPDCLWIYGDIAYNKGPFFSPEMYRQLLMPFHRRYCALAKRHGCQVVYHSDGDARQMIPHLIAAGIDALHPMEVKAGMNVLELKQQYGDQIAFIGNIDARLFQANDREGLEAEIQQKVPAAMAGSGYVFHSDHSIPPGTRLDTYRFGLSLAMETGTT